MAFYSKKQVEEARKVDLLTYLQTMEPQQLVRISEGIWSTREHDSLKISNGMWMWWSRNIGGRTALDYLVDVRGMPFTEAVKTILEMEARTSPFFNAQRQDRSKQEKRKPLRLPQRAGSNKQVIAYLRHRGIDREIIDLCIRAFERSRCIWMRIRRVGMLQQKS